METKTFQVPNITCGHCVHTVESELKHLPGVQTVQAELGTKMVTVAWQAPATWHQIQHTLTEISYPPASA